MKWAINKHEFDVEKRTGSAKQLELKSGDAVVTIEVKDKEFWINGKKMATEVCWVKNKAQVWLAGKEFWIDLPSRGETQTAGKLTSPMPGKVLKILVAEGEKLEVGTPLLILEAMKMEHVLKAPAQGQVKKFLCVEGAQVEGETLLVDFEHA